MQTSISFKEPYMFSPIILIFLILILVVLTIYLRKTKKKVEKVEEKVKVIPEKNVKNIPVIKKKHFKELDAIEKRYNNSEITLRMAYQLVSENIRLFVFEVTDITTQNYSLAEIKKLDIKGLYELIEEYYEPEFASKSEGDFATAISKARRIIEEWN